MADSQSISQRRFRHALGCIRKVPASEGGYLNWVRSLAADMRTIGMGQTLAALRADDNKPGARRLFTDIENWLTKANSNSPYYNAAGLFEAITTTGQDKYILAFAELDAYLGFLKRLAEAFLKNPANASAAETE